jgi:Fe-S-cluster containining protein
MDAEDLYRSLSAALVRSEEAREEAQKGAAASRAELELLLEILEGQGVLNDGHRRLIAKVKQRAANNAPRTVRLNVIADKRQVPNSEIDCQSLVHLCKARCCTFAVELSKEDVEEGKLLWELDQPYLLRREPDGFGYCTHFDRAGRGCTVYEDRPATCRSYDCRQDRRVWIDFDQRIPAP